MQAPESTCHGVPESETHCWRNASILNADLTHPRLLSAVQHLAPALWRIGGSPADMTTYGGFGSTPCPRSCAPLVTAACGEAVFASEDTCKHCLKQHPELLTSACAAQNSGFGDICKQQGDDTFYCMAPARWSEVLNFAAKADAKVVFGLNYASASVWVGNGSAARWNSKNAAELLQYTFDHKLPLHGVELGNELNIKLREPNTTRLAAAFVELRRVIDGIWGASATNKPVVIGPDVSWVHDQPGDAEGTKVPNQWLKGFLKAGKDAGLTPDAVTFHHYPAGKLALPSGGVIDGFIFDPQFYAQIVKNFTQIAADVKSVTGQDSSKVWWGEGAFEFHSGKKGTTNAYEDVLFSAVQIGTLAQLGYGAWARSTLFGGFYELLDHTNGYAPNPSWWLGALLNKLVFGAAPSSPLQTYAVTSSVPTLQAFVFTAGAGAHRTNVAVLVNLGSADLDVQISLGKASKRVEYVIQASGDMPGVGDMHSQKMWLNGQVPAMAEDGTVPPSVWTGTTRAVGGAVSVPARGVVLAIYT